MISCFFRASLPLEFSTWQHNCIRTSIQIGFHRYAREKKIPSKEVPLSRQASRHMSEICLHRDTLWCLRLIKDKTKAISAKWKKFKFFFAVIDTVGEQCWWFYLPNWFHVAALSLRRIFLAVNRSIKFSQEQRRKMENYSLQTFDGRLIAFMITFTFMLIPKPFQCKPSLLSTQERSFNIKWISVI